MSHSIFSHIADRHDALRNIKGCRTRVAGYLFSDYDLGLNMAVNVAADLSISCDKRVCLLVWSVETSREAKRRLDAVRRELNGQYAYMDIMLATSTGSLSPILKDYDVVIVLDIERMTPSDHCESARKVDQAMREIQWAQREHPNHCVMVFGYIDKAPFDRVGMHDAPGTDGDFECICQQIVYFEERDNRIKAKVLKNNQGNPREAFSFKYAKADGLRVVF